MIYESSRKVFQKIMISNKEKMRYSKFYRLFYKTLNSVYRMYRILKYYKVVEGPLTYNYERLATRNNADFLQDPHFLKSYAAGESTGSWGDAKYYWQAYVACWAAERSISLDGDFVECGVNKGGLARTIIEFTNFKDLSKQFYLFDTFNGFDDKMLSEEEFSLVEGKRKKYKECFNEVQDTFFSFNNVILVRGSVPITLSSVDIKVVSYLSIDMNCVIPEIAAAEFFWDKIVSGGVILLDDYGAVGHIMQKKAFDIFCENRGVRVLPLPTGQGLIIKP